MQHLLLTRIVTKPHIAQYITARFLEEDAVIRIPDDDLILPVIAACLTANTHERFQDNSHKLTTLSVLLPRRYRSFYLHRDYVNILSKTLEQYFWREVELFIYRILNEQRRIAYKEDAIKDFYATYFFTESLYPVGHFRRQLLRRSLNGSRVERRLDENQETINKLERRISKKLSNQQCLQLYRVHKSRKISLRVLAPHYKINHSTAGKIIKKINTTTVLKRHRNATL